MATYGGRIPLGDPRLGARGDNSASGAPGFAGVPYGDLASKINAGMTVEAAKPYAANLPNYANMVGKRSENIMGQLAGQVPDDVVNQIIQTGAERGILTGSAMSPNSNSAMLRALGLTSMGLQQQGSQNLSSAIADTPVPQLFNPASLIVPTTLAQQEMDAAIAGRNGGTGLGGSGYFGPASGGTSAWGGGGAAINPYQGGASRQEIPRWSAGASPVAYGPGGGPNASWGNPAPQAQDNWWERDANNSSAWPSFASQNYWDSSEGLQNPNRPADQMNASGLPFDEWGDTYEAPGTSYAPDSYQYEQPFDYNQAWGGAAFDDFDYSVYE